MKRKTPKRALIAVIMAMLLAPTALDAHGRHRSRDAAYYESARSRSDFETRDSRQRDDDRRASEMLTDQQRPRRAAYRDMEERCSRGGVGSIIGAIAGGLLGNGGARRASAASHSCN